MDKCPAVYWDPSLAVQQRMGRAYTPIRWRCVLTREPSLAGSLPKGGKQDQAES
jgi:hypothetical protein